MFGPRNLYVALALLIIGLTTGDATRGPAWGGETKQNPFIAHRRGDGGMARGTRHQAQSDNWAGYTIASYQSGLSYTAIQGAWIIPTVTASAASGSNASEYSASWIGIGGSCEDANCDNTDSSLIQVGTEQDVGVTADGTDQYSAWYELLPNDSIMISHAVPPGDAMTASIQCTALCSNATQTWTITISDTTADWTWSKTLSYASSELSVEWIEEATSICGRRNSCTEGGLADFGQVTFSQITANGLNPNLSLEDDGIELTDGAGQTGNPSASAGGDAFTVCWGTATFTPCSYEAGASPLVAAVLPSSRSIEVGGSATAFATMINTGPATASGCTIGLGSNIPATLSFQTTNPSTNAVTGSPNTPVDIPGGGTQSFVVALTPSASVSPTPVVFEFVCENANAAAVEPGVDTLLFSASTTAVPDIVALVATASGDGILHVSGTDGSAAFAVATVNLGSAATISASVNTGSANLPLTILLCETNPSTGACLAAPTSTVTLSIATDATPTFAVFATATGSVPFLPATNRLFVQYSDGAVVRGSTSVAVETQ